MLYNVERFWGGKWEVFYPGLNFLAACRIAAVWHRRGIEMRIRDEAGGLMPEDRFTGKLSDSQEEIISTYTKRIGP